MSTQAGPLSAVDFSAVFAAQPTAYLVMTPDLVIVEANAAYLTLLGRTREELVGRWVFDAFPPALASLGEDGSNPLQASFERARDSGRPDPMPLFHYEVLDTRTGRLVPRTWSLISVPVLDDRGATRFVLQRVEDVTEYLADRDRVRDDPDGSWTRLENDLFARTQELRAALDAREAASRRLAAMAEVVLRLADAGTVSDVTDILAGAGLAAIGADGGAIAVRDDDAGVVHLTMTPSLGAGAQRQFGVIDLASRLPAAWAARTGETVVFHGQAEAEAWTPEMREAFERSGHRSWITVPLATRGRLLGSLLAGWTADRGFTGDEVGLVQAFGTQCAQALDRVRELDAERGRARDSRVLAENLQRSMLTEPFQPDHCQIVVRYLPAMRSTQVGGDWYDAFLQADGLLNLVIGDVVGHDIGAVAMMGQLRSLLRGISLSDHPEPARVLDTLDAAMGFLALDTYATVGMARVEQTPEEVHRGVSRLRWASAGHLPPVVVTPDGTLLSVPATGGQLMLGVDPTRARGQSVLEVPRGSTVLLYTDGLVERPDRDLDTGVAELERAVVDLVDLPLDELCDRVLDRLLAGQHDDDVALVAVRLHRQDRPRPAEAGPQTVPSGVPEPADPAQ